MKMPAKGLRALLCAALLSPLVPAACAAADADVRTVPSGNAGFTQPAAALGSAWSSSTDELVTATGDSDGYHVMVAREDTAFRWQNLVTLNVPQIDLGPWTGEICTTGDGKYAVAVYAPSADTNTPALVEAGAYASVIDLATGKATPVAAGVSLAYDDPGCGLGDTVVLTRALGRDEQQTQLIDVDAATARATTATTVPRQITDAFPSAEGNYGVAGNSLVRIGAGGSVSKLAKLAGTAYSVVPTNHGVDVVSASGKSGVVQHWDGTRLVTLGRGRLTDLQLYPQARGGDLLVGDTAAVRPQDSGMRTLSRSRIPDAVSRQGDETATQVVSEEVESIAHKPIGAAPPIGTAGRIVVSATATHSSAPAYAVVPANGPVSTATAPLPGTPQATTKARIVVNGRSSADRAAGPMVFQPGYPNPSAANDTEEGVDLSYAEDAGSPTCLVPRNSPSAQALQPTPAMVEWAVDQAVHGELYVQRPANYLGTGLPSYEPQQMFPPSILQGPISGEIPAQVELGILAQESNFDEASWHAVPGDSGNPLIADYYGTAATTKSSSAPDGVADDPDVVPNYSATDCGYGIGQVTDGMSSSKPDPLSTTQATAVATDYAANIAASVQILSQTWNQLAAMSPAMLLNGGNPNYIENWYFALWGYNSGVYPQADAAENGNSYGLGWFNNPANPNYPANRAPFEDNVTSSNDAANPQYWPYQEKIMGWIEHPQFKGSTQDYSVPNFGSSVVDPTWGGVGSQGPGLNLPGYDAFCSTEWNDCSPDLQGACPPDNSECWWNQPVTWISSVSTSTAATEKLTYANNASEPAMKAQYPADCPDLDGFYRQFSATPLVVTDLNDPDQNTRGCNWSTRSDGKFTIRLGDNVSVDENQSGDMQANPLSAQIDLHQIGAGFLGHFYFTHTYDGTTVQSTFYGPGDQQEDQVPVPAQIQHKVTGVWTPDIAYGSAAQNYEILAAIPDHGANAPSVVYHVDQGEENSLPISTSVPQCQISQSSNGNRWVFLGNYKLAPGADVWLDNMVKGANGTSDVAFSTLVFVPMTTSYACGSAANLTVG